MNWRLFAPLLLFAIILAACSSSRLDRSTAAAAVTNSTQFQAGRVLTVSFPVGSLDASLQDGRRRLFATAGFLQSATGAGAYKVTPRGREIVGETPASSINQYGVTVELTTNEFEDVVRVGQDGQTAIVDFKWRERLTPAGRSIAAAAARLRSDPVAGSEVIQYLFLSDGREHQARAFLRRFDDGWRVDKISE